MSKPKNPILDLIHSNRKEQMLEALDKLQLYYDMEEPLDIPPIELQQFEKAFPDVNYQQWSTLLLFHLGQSNIMGAIDQRSALDQLAKYAVHSLSDDQLRWLMDIEFLEQSDQLFEGLVKAIPSYLAVSSHQRQKAIQYFLWSLLDRDAAFALSVVHALTHWPSTLFYHDFIKKIIRDLPDNKYSMLEDKIQGT